MPATTLTEFSNAAACYSCLSEHDRAAFKDYLKALELKANGGQDWTSQFGNLAAAVAFTKYSLLSPDQHDLAQLVIQKENAEAAGATVPADIQPAIACLSCFDTPMLKAMDLFLARELGPHMVSWSLSINLGVDPITGEPI